MPTRIVVLSLCLAGLAGVASGQDLGGTWQLVFGRAAAHPVDPREAFASLAPDERPARPVQVPGALETAPWWDAARAEGHDSDGVFWFGRRLPAVDPLPEGMLRELQFDDVNDRCDVWLDGHHLGRHEGSDIPFAFDVSARAPRAGQALWVRVVDPGDDPVDGLRRGARPHAKESWYHDYGGLLGDVRLAVVPPVEALHPDLSLDADGDGRLRLALRNRTDATRRVQLSVRLADRPTLQVSDHDLPPGRHELVLDLPDLSGLPRWSPADPRRLALHVTVHDGGRSRVSEFSVGLRRFAVDGTRFTLDGEPLALRGVLYQPSWPATLGRPTSEAFLRAELTAIRDAGFDLVRAHIKVMPQLYALCDELGLLVQAEPTLGWITRLEPHTLPAVDAALVALADAVRGHPSVVMVGLLNELSGELHPHTRALLERAHELLPDHLLLDDSGSWQGTAHYWNPGAPAPVPYDDLHVYRAWPWEPRDLEHAADLGADHERLVYVSEYGFGGLPDFDAVERFGDRQDLPDAREAAALRRDARAELESGRLDGLADDLAELSALGQRNQARAAAVMAGALRANPRVAGTVYTQWRDASWECGAGLTDLWARPKPALEVFRQLNGVAPRDPALLDPRPAAPPVRDSAVLARLLLPTGSDSPPGVDGALAAQLSALTTRDTDSDLPPLAVLGRVAAPWSPERIDQTLALLGHAREGGVLLWLGAPDAGRPLDSFLFGYDGRGQVADLPFDLTARGSRGHFVGNHLVFRKDSPLLAGLDVRDRLLDERFALLAPHRVLRVGPLSEHEVVARELACLDGYGLQQGSAVVVLRFGRGRVVLSTLRLGDESLADPFGRRLLENLVALAADHARRTAGPDALTPRAPLDAGLARDVGRMVWRHELRHGQAERLVVQTHNGVRSVRRELPGREEEVRRLSGLLRRLVAGQVDGGLRAAVSALADLPTHDEELLRKELELSRRFYRPEVEDPAPRELSRTLAIGRAHAAALGLARDGRRREALAALDRAIALTVALDAAEEDGPPADPAGGH